MHASLWTLLSFTTTALVSTAPSLARAIRRDEAGALEVQLVNCTAIPGVTGKLLMLPSSPSLPVALNMTDDRGLAEIGESAQSLSVIFESCDSTMMKYVSSPDEGIYFGHLKLADNQTQCLTSSFRYDPANLDNPQSIGQNDCALGDDSSQFAQFWSISFNVSDTTVPAHVEFSGRPLEKDSPIHLITQLRGDEGNRVANVLASTGPSEETFALSLVLSSE